jgi:EAL and modified HD-GYP domain-containing signal transduction protein
MSAQYPTGSIRGYPVELMGSLRSLARQPILDLRGRVHGYELLYRIGDESAFHGDGELASRTVMDDTVIFGVEKFTGTSFAFINCTSETLTEDLVRVLSPQRTVLEILESAEPSPELIAVCRSLKALGYRLALDDFAWAPKFVPLVELADYIKVDFISTGPDQRRELLRRLKDNKVAMVAEKVETQQEYQQACLEGFTLFQGFYFCRPELMRNRKVPSNHLCYFEILQLLHADPVDLGRLSQAVKKDESLTYRILRMVNSAAFAIRTEVTSVRSALVFLGEDTFRRIATLAIATEFNRGRPPEILKMAMIRARFCELAAAHCAFSSNEQYLLGMFSLLPAMLAVPMEELTPALPLRKEIREALQGTVNREGSMLEWLRRHEHGDWATCETIALSNGVDATKVNNCYAEAVLWAEDQFHSAD